MVAGISSLSAILLNDDFYEFMLSGRKIISGVSILGAEHIIPFKMFAWLDLKDGKAKGEHVNERDLKKHKNDVFRLLQIVNPDHKIVSEGMVKESIVRFLEEIAQTNINLAQLGVPFEMSEAIGYLRRLYL